MSDGASRVIGHMTEHGPVLLVDPLNGPPYELTMLDGLGQPLPIWWGSLTQETVNLAAALLAYAGMSSLYALEAAELFARQELAEAGDTWAYSLAELRAWAPARPAHYRTPPAAPRRASRHG